MTNPRLRYTEPGSRSLSGRRNKKAATPSLEDRHLRDIGAPAPGENPGVWIEDRCRELSVSVSEIARQARVDRVSIYRWKTGELDPRLSTFNRVRVALNDFWARRRREKGA